MDIHDLMRTAYRVFDPAPLAADDEDLYVDLDDVRGGADLARRLENAIQSSDEPTCQLLAGHRGSGKTTELCRLARAMESGGRRYFVLFCKADDDVDRNDVDFPDVLIAIVRQLAVQLKKRLDIELQPNYFRDRWERLKRVLGSEVSFDDIELGAGMLKVSGAIKSSPDARVEIRKLLEPDTNNWLSAANEVIGEAKRKLRQKGYVDLVVIVDDLDKMVLRAHATANVSTGEHLFVNREAQLSAFQCHLLYTIPLSLAYSGQERTLANLYGRSIPIIPMTKISSRPPRRKTFPAGRDKFRKMIAMRLKKAGVEESAIFKNATVRDSLIKLSGGQPRELMMLIREAIISSDLPIDSAAVKRALREGRNAYARQLLAEHWKIIDEVRQCGQFTRTAGNDVVIREVLDRRAILQYEDDELWYAVNPLVPEQQETGLA